MEVEKLERHKVDAVWVESVIEDFIASPANTMRNAANEPAWDEPIIGYSNGADPLYDFYEQDIGDFYVKPLGFMKHTYPNLFETPPTHSDKLDSPSDNSNKERSPQRDTLAKRKMG